MLKVHNQGEVIQRKNDTKKHGIDAKEVGGLLQCQLYESVSFRSSQRSLNALIQLYIKTHYITF